MHQVGRTCVCGGYRDADQKFSERLLPGGCRHFFAAFDADKFGHSRVARMAHPVRCAADATRASSDVGSRGFEILLQFGGSCRSSLLYIHGEWQTLAMTEPPSGDPLDVPQSYPAFVLKRLLVSAVDWLAYPLIILAAAGPLGIENRVVPYIVAQNWSTVIVSAVVAAPGIMFGFGLMSGTIAGMMTLALFAFALRYFYLVARIALDAPVSLAIGLVAFNAVSSIFLSQLAMRLI
ncbi:MAG: hypothetical protein H6882_04475 [Rhodobiaceae bacterium]|nr:hypothetical protein [Rhodobiaceae bacterium]